MLDKLTFYYHYIVASTWQVKIFPQFLFKLQAKFIKEKQEGYAFHTRGSSHYQVQEIIWKKKKKKKNRNNGKQPERKTEKEFITTT